MRKLAPFGAVVRGLAAGAFGTALMTGWQGLTMKLRSSSEDSTRRGETEPGGPEQDDPWQRASAPAKVGRKILEGVFDYEVPPEGIGLLTNVMHWSYGISWGAVYGLIRRSASGSAVHGGLKFGSAVWAMSYVTLVPLGIYRPPWKYSPGELALDLSYHLAYGMGVGLGHEAIAK